MDIPFIGNDTLYQVHVMWLDSITTDSHMEPDNRRYSENKRSTKVHSKGWDLICAATVDAPLTMIQDGHYMKLSATAKNEIIDRKQSWILLDDENDQALSENPLPVRPLKLRPGQPKPKPKKTRQQRRPTLHATKSIPQKKKQDASKRKPKRKPPTSTSEGFKFTRTPSCHNTTRTHADCSSSASTDEDETLATTKQRAARKSKKCNSDTSGSNSTDEDAPLANTKRSTQSIFFFHIHTHSSA